MSCLLSVPLSLSHTHAHMHTHILSHTRLHARSHSLSLHAACFQSRFVCNKKMYICPSPLSAFVMLLRTLLSRYFLILSPSLSLSFSISHIALHPQSVFWSKKGGVDGFGLIWNFFSPHCEYVGGFGHNHIVFAAIIHLGRINSSLKNINKKIPGTVLEEKVIFFANSRRHQRTSSSTPSERRRHRRRRRCRCRRGNFGLSRKPNHVGRSKIYERSYQNVGNRAVQPGTNLSKHLISNFALLGITVFISHLFWWQLELFLKFLR